MPGGNAPDPKIAGTGCTTKSHDNYKGRKTSKENLKKTLQRLSATFHGKKHWGLGPEIQPTPGAPNRRGGPKLERGTLQVFRE